MILYIYFARRFFTMFAIVFGALFLLTVLIDMLEQLRRFKDDDVGFGDIAILVGLSAPAQLYQLLPLVMVLASISLFLGLSRSSELVVARAAGRSALRSLLAPLVATFLIGVFSVLAFNPIVAATQKQYEVKAAEYSGRPVSVFSVSSDGLWLRQGGAEEQIVINAKRANLDGTRLFDVTLFGFDETGKATRRISANFATLEDGYWALKSVTQWPINIDTRTLSDPMSLKELRVASDLTKDHIKDSFGTPASIPIWQLPAFISQLETAGFSARRHQVWLHMELALPFFLMAIVMIGAAFTLRHSRVQKASFMIIMAVLFGFGLFFIRNFAQILSENGQVSHLLAAWAPPLAAIGVSLGFLLHTEDG